jgi:hypothetical protein
LTAAIDSNDLVYISGGERMNEFKKISIMLACIGLHAGANSLPGAEIPRAPISSVVETEAVPELTAGSIIHAEGLFRHPGGL